MVCESRPIVKTLNTLNKYRIVADNNATTKIEETHHVVQVLAAEIFVAVVLSGTCVLLIPLCVCVTLKGLRILVDSLGCINTRHDLN